MIAERNATFTEVLHVSASTRVFAAMYAGFPLGAITVCETTEAVELVFVQEAFRRQGLATRLLEYAREQTGLPLDMDGGDRTPDGKAWAACVGLRSQGRVRGIPQADVDRIGNRLMVQLYDA